MVNTINRAITLEDIEAVHSPQTVAQLFQTIGYNATAQSLDIADLDLPTRSAAAIDEAFLIDSYERDNQILQILLFQLTTEDFASRSRLKNRVKLIATRLCDRPVNYLLVFTYNYQQLLFASPQRRFDEYLNLTTDIEAFWLDLKDVTPRSRNWLNRLSLECLSPQALHQKHREVLRDAALVQQSEQQEVVAEDCLGTYLREIGKTPLLTLAQEIELGRAVQKRKELLLCHQQLQQKLNRSPTLEELAVESGVSNPEKLCVAGTRAREKLVTANLRLVVSVAKKYQGRGIELLDLIQEGAVGLIRAVEKFDARKGYRFSTYSYWWIRQAMTRMIRNQSRVIRIPVYMYDAASALKKARRSLTQELHRSPTVFEIAKVADIEISKARKTLECFSPVASLDQQINQSDSSPLGEMLECKNPSSAEHLDRRLMREGLKQALKAMDSRTPERDYEILVLRFGLADGRERSLQEIGDRWGLTRERVRQVIEKRLQRLRANSPHLRQFI